MLRNHITYSELVSYYPNLKTIIDESDIMVQLNSATMLVANDLRTKGYDVGRVYIPKMFETAYGVAVSRSNYTSPSISVETEKRFVVDVSSTTGASITLQGSIDNTNFVPIKDMQGDDLIIQMSSGTNGTFSKAFFEGYPYMRYQITGSVTMYSYLVSTDVDQLIIQRVIQLVTLPLIGTDGIATELYNASVQIYASLLQSLIIDYDINKDNQITPNEDQVIVRMRMSR